MADTETIEKPKGKGKAPVAEMALTMERAALVKAIGNIQSVVERRNTIPVLANVLIEADADGKVSLVGTDLNLQVREKIASEVDAAGGTTVEAAMLHDIARELPDGSQVRLEVDSGRLLITAGRAKFNLPVIPRGDFPMLAPEDLPTRFEMPATMLRQCLAAVGHAMIAELARPYLDGIFVQRGAEREDRLTFSATNGNILATVAIPAPEGSEGAKLILPRKGVAQLSRLLDGFTGDVTVEMSDSKFRVTAGAIELVGKAVEGSIPPWHRVVPAGHTCRARIDAEGLERGVRRVSLVAKERTHAVKFEFEAERLVLSVQSFDGGTATEELPLVYDGPPLTVGFNARYLADTLRAIDSDEVQIDLTDAASPTLFTNPTDEAGRWVVMPLRV